MLVRGNAKLTIAKKNGNVKMNYYIINYWGQHGWTQ